jgi:hypothetical protein
LKRANNRSKTGNRCELLLLEIPYK